MSAQFHRAILLYNPVSGNGALRRARLQKVVELLRPLAGEILLEPTRAAGSGGEQAKAAIAGGCDLVLSCGGDGTAFDILQGVAESSVAFGVLPFGTANILASDLGLPRNPLRAAAKLVSYRPRRVPVGRIVYEDRSRYFTVAAGAGVDAKLVANSGLRKKRSSGFAAYYLSGLSLMFCGHFPRFEVEIERLDGSWLRRNVWEVVAMRVSSFGRFLSLWQPGSSLESQHLQLVLMRESSRLRLVLYVLKSALGLANKNAANPRANFEIITAQSVRFYQVNGELPLSQADGEVLGTLPQSMEVVPDALNLLMPPQF